MGGTAVDIVARLRLNAEQFSSEGGKAAADIAEKMKTAAQSLPQSFNQAFSEVQALASKGLNLGDQVKSLSDGAIAAEAKAIKMRALAEATDRVAASGRADAEALRLEADAARVAALASEQDAEALRSRAAQLELIQQELAKATGATNAFDDATKNGGKSSGAQRAGLQQLSMQLNDVATMYAGGASAAQIFATQSGQVVQALQLIGGEGNAVLRFLGGWQGMLITTVAVALVPFIAKLFDTSEAEKAQAESTKKLRQEIDQLRTSTERAIFSQERLRGVMGQDLKRQSGLDANAVKQAAIEVREAQKRYQTAMELVRGGGGLEAIQAAGMYDRQLQDARKKLADARKTWDATREARKNLEIQDIQAEAVASIDKSADATRRASQAKDELTAAYKRGSIGRDEYLAGYARLEQAERAEIQNIKDAAKEQRSAASEAKQAARERASEYENLVKTLDPVLNATEQYIKLLKEIDEHSKGKNPQISAEKAASYRTAAASRYINQLDPEAEKARDKRFEQAQKAQEESRRAFDKSADDAAEKMAKRSREGLVQSAEDAGRVLGRAAGDELRTVFGNLADLFGIRISGPLALFMRPGGIGAGADATSSAILKAIDNLGYTLPEKTKAGVRDGVKTLFEGAAYGQLGGSVFASLTGTKENKLASGIGGVLGESLGKSVGPAIAKTIGGTLGKTLGGAAGPLGSILGGVLGGLVGGLFNKPKWSDAQLVLNPYGQVQGGAGTGKGAAEIAAATNSANSVASAVNSIVQQLGATVQGLAPMTLGTWDGKYRVALGNTSEGLNAKSTLGRAGLIQDFGGDQEAAIKYAVAYQLSHAVITGISEASKRILASGQDINSALTKVMAIESIPKDLKAMLDPVGAAIDELNRKWKQTVNALDEGGASAEQRAQAERLYNLQLDQVKNSTASATQGLKDFLNTLGIGSNSPLSLRDQEAAAKTQLQPFLDAISSGKSIDQSKYQAAAQSFLDVERQLYGSGGQYFDAFELVRTATNAAISAIDNVAPIGTPVESPFAKKTAENTEAAAEISAETRDLIATLVEQNRQLLARLGNSDSGFLTDQRGFGGFG